MDEQFYTILTKTGKAVFANSTLLGNKINFQKIKLGSGKDGKYYYNPTEDQTALEHEEWEGNVSNVQIDSTNPNWVIVETIIPADVGGFYIREAAVYDSLDNLIAVGKLSETYKPTLQQGAAKDLMYRVIFEVSNTTNVVLKLDSSTVLATKKDIEVIESKINSLSIPDMKYEYAGGTATAIDLTLPTSLEDGYYKKFIANYDNGGAATTINGKPFYKVCSTNPPNIKKDRPYEAYYNLPGDCFFLKASATGTVSADNVLAGETYSTEDDIDLVGTMPDKGDVTFDLSLNGVLNLPRGCYNSIKITQNITTRGATTDSVSTNSDDTYLYTRIPTGAYFTTASSGYPEIRSKLSDVSAAIKNISDSKKDEIIKELGGSLTSYGTFVSPINNTGTEVKVGFEPDLVIVGGGPTSSLPNLNIYFSSNSPWGENKGGWVNYSTSASLDFVSYINTNSTGFIWTKDENSTATRGYIAVKF